MHVSFDVYVVLFFDERHINNISILLLLLPLILLPLQNSMNKTNKLNQIKGKRYVVMVVKKIQIIIITKNHHGGTQ